MDNTDAHRIANNHPNFAPIPTGWNCATGAGQDIPWNSFVTLEIVPVIISQSAEGGGTETTTTTSNPDKATHWSIYGRWASGECDLLHDATNRVEALIRAADASAHTGLPLQVLATDGGTRLRATNIRPFLDLSTAHISEETANWLTKDGRAFSSETGFLIWVPGEYIGDPAFPDDLLTLLKAALGVADYLMLDRDAPTDERFQIFDW